MNGFLKKLDLHSLKKLKYFEKKKKQTHGIQRMHTQYKKLYYTF